VPGITYFVALPFDVADGSVVVGEPIECPSPAAAIGRAQGLWKILGHTGAVAFSRTGDPATEVTEKGERGVLWVCYWQTNGKRRKPRPFQRQAS
jgi:hypothetical protein